MTSSMTQWQEQSVLEEYLYSHLQLRPVDFLPRSFRAEREIERIGMAELALDASTLEERTALFDRLRKGHAYDHVLATMRARELFSQQQHPYDVVLPGVGWEVALRKSAARFQTFMGCTHLNARNAVKTLGGFFKEHIAGIEASFSKRGVMDRFSAPWGNLETPTISSTDRSAACSIVSGYHRQSRVLVPLAQRGTERFVVYPFDDKAPVYNLARLLDGQRSPAVVEWNRILLLTDSIEIAWRNDLHCTQISQRGLLWSSWHGGIGRIGSVDWSPLKDRKIYYVVLDHSGYTADGACQVALQVGKAIKSELGMDLTYLICLERATGTGKLKRVPIALSAKQFTVLASRTKAEFSAGANVARQAAYRLPMVGFQGKRERVFHPFIHEGTTTLLYGRDGVGKSWLAAGIAVSAASGKTLFGSWQAECPTDVVYICSDAATSPIVEKLEALLKSHKSEPILPVSTGVLRVTFVHHGTRSSKLTVLCISDAILSTESAGVLFWHQSVAEYMESPPTPGRLVILDGFSSLKYLDKAGRPALVVRNCIDEMLLGGGAIIAVASSEGLTGNEVQTMKRKIPFDSIVRVEQRRTPDASLLGISVHVEKGFSIPKGQRQSLSVELDPSSGTWNLKQSSSGPLGELKLVAKYMGTKKTDQEIAIGIGLSLELVKKRKRQLRGKEALPASIRRNRSEFEAAMQLINRILNPTGLPHVPPPPVQPKLIQ
jgi:hypothetical protein